MAEKNNDTNTYENIVTNVSKGKVYSISKNYPAYIILLLMLGLSFFIWRIVHDKVHDENRSQFEKAVKSVETRVLSLAERKTEFLHSMRGIYDLLPQVVKDYFELYATVPAQTYPSILSISYVPKVSSQDLPLFIFNTKSQGYYSYDVHPKLNASVHYPVELIVPFNRNGHISGLDFASNPKVKTAIEKACDLNTDIASDFFCLRGDTLGFFIVTPVYARGTTRNTLAERRANFQGAILLEVDAKVFFEKALTASGKNEDSLAFASDEMIAYKFESISADGSSRVVYQSKNADLFNRSYSPAMTTVVPFKIADKVINFKFKSVPGFGGKFQQYLPLLSLIISLVLSFALFGFLLSITTSKAKAIDLAERMTRSQRRIVETSKDVIAVMDPGGSWKSMNPAAVDVFGYSPESMIGKNIRELLASGSDQLENVLNSNSAVNEETERIVVQMLDSAGNVKWISWSFTISRSDNLVYSIGRDVTLEKIAEEQALLRSKQIQLAEQYAHEASQSKTLFMIKLSHQLRNSLTSIIGYLQLLQNEAYENDEERSSFLTFAEESSEELFSFVSDIIDAAIHSDTASNVELSTIRLDKLLNQAEKEINSSSKDKAKVKIEMLEGVHDSCVVADPAILAGAIEDIIIALGEDLKSSTIQVASQTSEAEAATEIQIVGPGNEVCESMIRIYKQNFASLVDALKYDNEDIILRFARAASNIRRMNGVISIESFGGDEGNLVMITLPSNRRKL